MATSKRVGKKASGLLRSKRSTAKVKSVSGSAMSSLPDKKRKSRKKK